MLTAGLLVRVRAVSSAKEFREYARECLDWANTARSERERSIFLQMAEIWIDAATRLEVDPANLVTPIELRTDLPLGDGHASRKPYPSTKRLP
jgi:hypothetical protein